ncbi:molecular chaperone [Burkholderia ubonensis]|uniref:fimbrial biogenesis chaperone n=1 Tax=Burkholderia ubonensis TaxID=101571 RepID=UPI000ADE070D|nr:molecular chaperone [Burkholderia ubonensis]
MNQSNGFRNGYVVRLALERARRTRSRLTQAESHAGLVVQRTIAFSLAIIIATLQPLTVTPANATLVIDGTRVIYPETSKSVTVPVNNPGGQPVLMQSWITDASDADNPAIPFAIAEPLLKVEPNRSRYVRIFYAGEGMPSDRESMLFLNIMAIPIKPTQQDAIQFAVKQRLKLFYRPDALRGSASDAVAALRWQINRGRVAVVNGSPFHVSLIDLDLQWPGGHRIISDYLLLEPGETRAIDALVPDGADALTLRFVEINDVGLQVPHKVSLL